MSDEDVMYEITVDQPSLPKGEQVQIPGLGTFENGYTYTVTKGEANGYRTYHTCQVDVLDEDMNVVGSDVELGPTLLQAAKSMYGVEVSTVEPETKNKNKNKATTSADKDTSEPNASVTSKEADASQKDGTNQKGGD